MKITAEVRSDNHQHSVVVKSGDSNQELQVPVHTNGQGSSINGGEFLFVALATCFCNDLYREANKRNLTIHTVEVQAAGEFSAEGEAGYNLVYSAKVTGDAPDRVLKELIVHTDQVAEIHNTLRQGVTVSLLNWKQII